MPVKDSLLVTSKTIIAPSAFFKNVYPMFLDWSVPTVSHSLTLMIEPSYFVVYNLFTKSDPTKASSAGLAFF